MVEKSGESKATNTKSKTKKPSKYDGFEEYEFGGPVGVTAIIIYSHVVLYYFWYSLTFNDGQFAVPSGVNDIIPFFGRIATAIQLHATPNFTIFAIYISFLASQLCLAAVLPGITVEGLEVPSLKRSLPYLCNAYAAYYLTLSIMLGLHFAGVLRLSYIYDNLGRFLTAAVVTSNISVVVIHLIAEATGAAERMSGNLIYDLFMGTALNPRIGIVDLKMVAEIRLSWLLLFMVVLSCACKQYETLGYVSGQMWFLLVAYWLYSNACAKGEHYVPTTWDMFHEKFGWMLNFWNLAGVPFLYCVQAQYAYVHPKQLPMWQYVIAYVALFGCYYVWDTANFHKNDFRMRERGLIIKRNAFPVLPGSYIEKAKFLKTKNGKKLLIDGWYGKARKIHYTADLGMAFLWGFICGFDSFLPYYYVAFFFSFLSHRCVRDDAKCAEKYGKDWDRYKEKVPYIWIPYVF